MIEHNDTPDSEKLRKKAEKIFRSKNPLEKQQFSESDALKLIHELEVHQIELEIQNDELMRAKEQAQQASDKYLELYDSSPSGYFTLAQNYEIIEVNLAGAKMLGRERKNLLNYNFTQFLSSDSKETFFKFIERIFANLKTETCEISLLHNNTCRYIYFQGYVNDDKLQCHISALDITTIKHLQQELEKAKKKAEESECLKTAFLANMSHEIRTPLNAILGFSELLTKKNTTEEKKKTFSEYIRINGKGLAKIIDDIIDVSNLKSNRLSIKNSSFNLNSLFNELNNYYESLLIQKKKTNITIELKIPDSLDKEFFIEGDEQRLKQILNNLITNAIKYSGKGKITFGCNIYDNKLHFFVKDMGNGISPENISKIFDRFVQLSPKYISKQEGTGLGLAICKDLVKLMGGELHVKSEVNKGSEFYFELPLLKTKKPKIKKEKTASKLKKDLSQCRILIADDEDSNYLLTKRILIPTKVAIDWAKNGKHAVEMAANNKYDLIIMDIKMPEMDGIEATRLIKKQNNDIPIIIQTAFAMQETKDDAIKAACDGFVVKPIALDVFLDLVNKHI